MKKILISVLVVVSLLIVGCKKDLDNQVNVSESLTPQLKSLHSQLPHVNYGNVKIVSECGILKFESWEHYQDVYKKLTERVKQWNDLFLSQYSPSCIDVENLSEDEISNLDEIVEEIGYAPFFPLIEFEGRVGFRAQSLRYHREQKVMQWLESGAVDDERSVAPNDSILIDPIEQAFFSSFREICIGDTIIQLRNDHSTRFIPISCLPQLNEIRNTPTKKHKNDGDAWRDEKSTFSCSCTLLSKILLCRWNSLTYR